MIYVLTHFADVAPVRCLGARRPLLPAPGTPFSCCPPFRGFAHGSGPRPYPVAVPTRPAEGRVVATGADYETVVCDVGVYGTGIKMK